MKKYYGWSFLVNFIPIITTYIILYDCQSDGCMGKFLVWITIPIWSIIYLIYFKLKKKDNNRYLQKLIIYFPSLLTTFLGILLTVTNDEEIIVFIYAFLILILPTFIYNILVDYTLNVKEKNKCKVVFHPTVIIVSVIFLTSRIYKPAFFDKDVFDIGRIEVKPSLKGIQTYLSDSTKNIYILPDSIKLLPYPDYKNWINEDDYYLYFKNNPTEVIHIKIVDWISKPYVEIKGIKTMKEEYKWQWRVKVKKNDEEAKRVLSRIDKTIKEIDRNITTKIKIHAP